MNADHWVLVTRRRVAAATVVAVVAAVAALGLATNASPRSAAATTCGSIPARAAKDPRGALNEIKGVSPGYRALYAGYQGTIYKSAWRNWKPKHDPPYTIGMSWDFLGNSWQTFIFNSVQKYLRRAKGVGKVIAVASPDYNPANQIQQYQSLVQQGVDLIVLQAGASPAFAGPIAAAAAKGIPTVTTINQIDSPYSVDVAPNYYLGPARVLAPMLKNILGGKGNVLGVHGIRTTAVDLQTWDSFKSLLALCPDVKLVGEVDGFFSAPAVKAGVLSFLSTNPGEVNAVIQTGIMSPSVIAAFQQAGRSVPPVMEMGAQKSSTAYWWQNRNTYKTVGDGGGGTQISTLVTRVVLRMLAGQGPKISDIIWEHPIITNENLSQFAKPFWTTETPGTVENGTSTTLRDQDMDKLFRFPNRKAAGF